MSELRQDLVSGDWIILSPERGGRPHRLFTKNPKRKPSPKKTCPFEDLKKSGNWPPILSWPNEKKWQVVLVRNKFPALRHNKACARLFRHGPYNLKTGAGEHDLIITRDHYKNFADLSVSQATRVFQILQERHRMVGSDSCNVYVSSFFNWGSAAGASIYHPHYQVLTLPIIPPNIAQSLRGGEQYFKKHGRCVRCVMMKNDLEEKTRIIEQNRFALASTPFVSKEPFEVRILPKKHLPYFGKAPLADLRGVAVLLQSVMRRMKKYLHDPDLNFFIHGAPLDYRRYKYHHWHVEVIPKVSVLGGFELSTGVDINVADPEMAAAMLRGQARN